MSILARPRILARPARVVLSLTLLVACSEDSPREPSLDEGGTEDSTEGEATGSAESQDTQPDTGDTSGSGETDDASTGESTCPEPAVASMLVDDPEVSCSEGFQFDAAYGLCASQSEAIGPFPPAMVAACDACEGVDCDAARWPVDQARGLRGTDPCWPGTTAYASICVDDEHGWGPFSPAMVAACKQAGGGELTCESMRWVRDFAEGLLPPELGADWAWIMPEDYGLRDDSGGGGAFSAPRLNNPGGHSGVDVLAPIGTPLFAPCEGLVLAGYDGGYGNYVQLSCALPAVIAGGEDLWVSLLFAHLDSTAVDSGETVSSGQQLGAVGKSGNAGSPSINAHVHFEIAVHASLAAAQAESHVSSNHAGNAAGDLFAARFSSECLDVLGLESTSGPSMKGRRPDPFMLMSCLSSDKPAIQAPEPGLQASWTPWSDHYAAEAFDVDAGL